MKKIIVFLLSTIFLLSQTSCSFHEKTFPMQLVEAELTEQEENIISLLKFDTSAKIFDFKVDETVKRISVNSYELDKNGKWKSINGGGNYSLDETKGRIALNFDVIANGMRVAIQDENGTRSSENTVPEAIDTSDMMTSTAYANNTTEIVYDEEIPIAIQVITTKDEIVSYDVEAFFESQRYKKFEYEHVYAITILFSQKALS